MSTFKKIGSLTKSNVVKSVGIYTFTNFFTKATSFFLLFLYTNPKYISPEENGLLSLFSTGIVFLMPFLSMGIIHSAGADYFKLNKKEFSSFFTTTLVLPLAGAIASFIFLFLFSNFFEENFGWPHFFIWLIPLITLFNFFTEHALSMIRNNNEPGKFLTVNITRVIIEISISVVLVVVFAWRWEGRVTGIAAAFIFSTAYALIYFYKKNFIFGRFNKKFIKNELWYAIPLIALQFGIFCMNASDKFFLAHYIKDDNATVGIYNIAWIFSTVLTILSNALLHYIFPSIYSTLSEQVINYKKIKKNFYFFIAAISFSLIMLLVFIPVAYKYFINEKYYAGLNYYYFLCLGVFIWCVNYFFYSFLLYYKEKKKLFVLSLFSIIVSLLVYNFMIKNYGAKGAAIANLIIYSLVFLLTLIMTQKFWRKIFFSQQK